MRRFFNLWRIGIFHNTEVGITCGTQVTSITPTSVPWHTRFFSTKKKFMLTMEPSRKRRRTEGKSYKYPYGKYTSALRKIITENYPRGSDGSIQTFGSTYADANPQQKATRMALRFKGEGDYLQDLMRGRFFKKNRIIGQGLRGLGSYMGDKIGASAGGRDIGANISKWLGFGDYGQIGNQITSSNSQTPAFVNAADKSGDIHLSHREFVGEIYAEYDANETQSHFTQQKFRINPGDATTFPWLNRLASQFELYDFEGLMFQYVPKYGEGAGTSNALGKVVFATNYDPSAPDFISTVQMQNYDYSTSTKPSIGVLHGIETDNKQQTIANLYVKTSPESGTDVRWSDLCNMFVATEGVPRSTSGTVEKTAVGEIYVTYRVKLSRAVILSNSIAEDPDAHMIMNTTFTNSGSTLSVVQPTTYDEAHALSKNFSINVTPYNSAGTFNIQYERTCPLGLYHVKVMIFDKGSKQITFLQPYTTSGAALIPFAPDGGTSTVDFLANNHGSAETGQPAMLQFYVTIKDYQQFNQLIVPFKTSPAEYPTNNDTVTVVIDYLGKRDDGHVKTGI